MTDREPDLMAELDDADRIISGEAEKIVTEWGVHWGMQTGSRVYSYGTDETGARMSAVDAARVPDVTATLVSRKVTYGAWRDAPGDVNDM